MCAFFQQNRGYAMHYQPRAVLGAAGHQQHHAPEEVGALNRLEYPVEGDGGYHHLPFNYWARSHNEDKVEAGDVNQFVDAIMLGTRFPPSLGKSPKSKKVVIANVTNINMSQLQFADPKVYPFLGDCSSVPIRFRSRAREIRATDIPHAPAGMLWRTMDFVDTNGDHPSLLDAFTNYEMKMRYGNQLYTFCVATCYNTRLLTCAGTVNTDIGELEYRFGPNPNMEEGSYIWLLEFIDTSGPLETHIVRVRNGDNGMFVLEGPRIHLSCIEMKFIGTLISEKKFFKVSLHGDEEKESNSASGSSRTQKHPESVRVEGGIRISIVLDRLDPEDFALSRLNMRRLDIPTDPRREGQGFVATFGLERRYNEFKVSDSSSTPEKASEISSSKSSSEKSPPEESSPDQDSQSGPQKRSRACASTSSGRRRKLDESGSLPAQSEESKSNSPESDVEDGEITLPSQAKDPEEPLAEQLDEEVFQPPAQESLCPVKEDGTNFIALDCEMVRTTQGHEVARASFVNVHGDTIYDELIQPSSPVADYLTQYSGITKDSLCGVKRTLRQAQREIFAFLGKNTYLIGHAISNDLRALRIAHDKIIDTTMLYPDYRGCPFSASLKHLTQRHLGRVIQKNGDSHDSTEDARAAMQLVLLKMHRGPSYGMPPAWSSRPLPRRESIFEMLKKKSSRKLKCAIMCSRPSLAVEEPKMQPWRWFGKGFQQEDNAGATANLSRINCPHSIPGVKSVHNVRRAGSPSSTPTKTRLEGTQSSEGSCAGSDAAHTPTRGTTASCETPVSTSAQNVPPAVLGSNSPSSNSPGSSSAGTASCLELETKYFDRADQILHGAIQAASEKPDFLWVDVPCMFEEPVKPRAKTSTHWNDLTEVDSALYELYRSLEEDTTLLVVAQGSLLKMKNLDSRSTNARWATGSMKKHQDQSSVAAKRRRDADFSHEDQRNLSKLIHENAAGLCFIAKRQRNE